MIKDLPVSWSFTTTAEPYNPTLSSYLATYVFWIAFAISVATTLLVGFAIWHRKKRANESAKPHHD
jgi:hypothetical protein